MTPHVDLTRAPRRSRLRRVLPLLLVAWMLLEIWLMIQVADATNGLLVVLLLVLGAVLGSRLIKRAGLRALRSASAAFEQGRLPESGAAETGTSLTVLAGLLLILPGFLSDALALTLLFPPTRALWRVAGRSTARKLVRAAPMGDPLADALRMQQQFRMHRPDGKVVQGEVVDPAEPQPRTDGDDPRPPLSR
ncbi:FxsA family membrane protein [Kitasatospora sp. NPDC006697]|uniref:FxsA family membrane protein n=1 Tax=Kitasatospora sp. NPDC006697 TaxID=3364020 RepID=UPI00367693EF